MEEVSITHPLGWAWSASTVTRSDSLCATSLRVDATGDWSAEFPLVAQTSPSPSEPRVRLYGDCRVAHLFLFVRCQRQAYRRGVSGAESQLGAGGKFVTRSD